MPTVKATAIPLLKKALLISTVIKVHPPLKRSQVIETAQINEANLWLNR